MSEGEERRRREKERRGVEKGKTREGNGGA